eukprot:491094_1
MSTNELNTAHSNTTEPKTDNNTHPATRDQIEQILIQSPAITSDDIISVLLDYVGDTYSIYTRFSYNIFNEKGFKYQICNGLSKLHKSSNILLPDWSNVIVSKSMENKILMTSLNGLTLKDIQLKGDIIIHASVHGQTEAFVFNKNDHYLYKLTCNATFQKLSCLNLDGVSNIVHCNDVFYVLMTDQTILELTRNNFKPQLFSKWSENIEIPKIASLSSSISKYQSGQYLLMIDNNHRLWVYGSNIYSNATRGMAAMTFFDHQPDFYKKAILHPHFKNIKVRSVTGCGCAFVVLAMDGKWYLYGMIGKQDVGQIHFSHNFFTEHVNKPYTVYKGMIQCEISDSNVVFLTRKNKVYAIGANDNNQISKSKTTDFYQEPKLISRKYIGIQEDEKVVKVLVGDVILFICSIFD